MRGEPRIRQGAKEGLSRGEDERLPRSEIFRTFFRDDALRYVESREVVLPSSTLRPESAEVSEDEGGDARRGIESFGACQSYGGPRRVMAGWQVIQYA